MATRLIRRYGLDGTLLEERTVEIPAEQTNAESIVAQIEAQIERAENADANWASLTPAQKDVVLRQTMLTTAKIARHLLNRFEAD